MTSQQEGKHVTPQATKKGKQKQLTFFSAVLGSCRQLQPRGGDEIRECEIFRRTLGGTNFLIVNRGLPQKCIDYLKYACQYYGMTEQLGQAMKMFCIFEGGLGKVSAPPAVIVDNSLMSFCVFVSQFQTIVVVTGKCTSSI